MEPPGDCRSELWFMYHLGRRCARSWPAPTAPRDRPLLDLTWDYPTEGAYAEPDAEASCARSSGSLEDGKAVAGYLELKDDGSTACGCWIYAGVYADEVNQAARRKPGREQSWVAPEWGWAWPMNRRILYNRASADPRRQAVVGAQALRLVGRGARASGPARTCRTSRPTMPPDYQPPEDARAEDALSAATPFIMQADGKGWLFVPSGLVDGPLPTHYEPTSRRSATPCYPGQQSNPARQQFQRPENPYNPLGEPGADVFPYVVTTYRLTEHHTAGGDVALAAPTSELQPEMFCEVSPQLAPSSASSTAAGSRWLRCARRSRRA